MDIQRLKFETHGNPREVLSVEQTQLPPLKDHQVLLQILASPINPADLNYIQGTYGIKPQLPACPGMEASARVLQSRCKSIITGDIVIPLTKINAWSSHCIADASDLVRLPAQINPLQAAMLKVNPATAHLLLNDFEHLDPTDTVVLNAANSGVGQCIIQLAAQQNIRTYCFVRNPETAPRLLALGATRVFQDNAEGYQLAKSTLTNRPAKLAFNCVGGESALRLSKLLGPNATHITYGAMAKKPLTIPNGPLIFKNITFKGLWVSRWIEQSSRQHLTEVYTRLAQNVLNGSLTQLVDQTFTLGNYPQAIDRLSSPQRNGKVLFKPH